MARTMLCENNLPKYFWGEAINTSYYVINRVSIRPMLSKTPYELYKGRKPNILHLRSFGCKCFILNNGKYLIGKLDAKSDDTIFIGYALNSKAYKVFNKTSLIVEKSIHNATPRKGVVVDDDVDIKDLKIEEPKEDRKSVV